MKLKLKMIQNIDILDVEVQLAEYQVELNNHIKFVKDLPLTEAETMDIESMFDETVKMLNAAKRGLGLTNKLSDSASRTRFRSRIMGNLNRIRAKLARITKALQTWYGMDDAQQQTSNSPSSAGIDQDDERQADEFSKMDKTTSRLSEDHPALKFQLATKKADKILKTINSVRDEGQYQVATKYAQLFMKKIGKHDFINKELNTALQAKAKALNINSNSVSSMTEA